MVKPNWFRTPSLIAATAPFMLLGAFLASMTANAAPILNYTLTSPAVIAGCTLHAGSGDEDETGTGAFCTSTSYTPQLADWSSTFITGNFDGVPPTTQTFQTAFTNWNVAQGANFGGMWAIKNGGNLDVTFTVVDTATAGPTLGGINPFTINIATNPGYTGPAINQLAWTQGLYISYEVKPPFQTDLKPPNNTLDTYSNSQGNGGAFMNPCSAIPGQAPGPNNNTPAVIGPQPAGTAYCDPIYPFQGAGASFFDGPQAFWPDESFRAIALLSTITFATDNTGAITERDLTVYNGVSWGFDLSVPEPGTVLLMVSALGLLAVIRRKALAG
ncbi:MAG TPA: PEP-CTERM sorting domain-containing protein [Candidatus Acidoferrum sp.]|nr:PEP-CTERM sorting domain-containing protein [Candidatus Acidoferrum sp.]